MNGFVQEKLKRGISDDDVRVRPWLPFKKKGDLIVLLLQGISY